MNHTVIIVEDNTQIRTHLIAMVDASETLDLLAAVGTFELGYAAIAKHNADVLLVDLGLPDGSGVDLIKAIDKLGLDTEALVVSGFSDEHHVFQALEAGAKGYISKHEPEQKITEAIEGMIRGGAPISPVIARLMLQRFQNLTEKKKIKPNFDMVDPLTERQMTILDYVSKGFSAKEIADILKISYFTVTTHVKHIYRKLKVNSRTEALFEAAQLGLISSPSIDTKSH